MGECVKEMTFEEEYEILKHEANKLFESEISGCETPKANCIVRRALRCIDKLTKENKLAKEYRELEEQGRLLKLPCKIGEKVYIPRCIEECKYDFECPFEDNEEWSKCTRDELCENTYKVYKIIEPAFELKMLANIGTRIFLTREEAEAKLKEMETSAKNE